MSELIIQEKKETINYGKSKAGLAKWLADRSGGMLDEKKAALCLLVAALGLILFSFYYVFRAMPNIDTQKNFKPASENSDAGR